MASTFKIVKFAFKKTVHSDLWEEKYPVVTPYNSSIIPLVFNT